MILQGSHQKERPYIDIYTHRERVEREYMFHDMKYLFFKKNTNNKYYITLIMIINEIELSSLSEVFVVYLYLLI